MMRSERPVFSSGMIWAFILGSVAGCSRESDTMEVRESSIEDAPLLAIEEVQRIGDRSDPERGFSRVSSMDVDRDGNLYVVEGSLPEIRVFSEDGTLLRRIGRRGQGPGEFGGANRFGVVGDTVWVVDAQLNRITLFNREGGLLSTGTYQAAEVLLPQGYGRLIPWMMRADGLFTSHFAVIGARREDPPTGVEPTDRIPVPFLLFDASGAVADTVGWAGRPPPRMWRPPSEEPPMPQRIEVGGRQVSVPRAPVSLPWWEPVIDGYVLVETPLPDAPDKATISITRFDFSEDTVFSRSLLYSPAPYTPTDLDDIARRAARGEAGGGVARVANAF